MKASRQRSSYMFAAVALSALASRCASAVLPSRRLRFIASTNRGPASFQPLADTLIRQNTSYNVASAYCSSPGPFDENSTLPSPPFCWRNFTRPVRAALPSMTQLPIIQLLGDNGPKHFASPELFAKLYVQWAQRWDFDGFLLDAEFRGDDAAFVHFLTVFGTQLHAAGKVLGVFLYPNMDKAKYINKLQAVDHWLGTWGGRCDSIPDVIWALHHDNNVSHSRRANLMLYPRDAQCNAGGIKTMFQTLVEADVEEVGFWANSVDLGPTWLGQMTKFLRAL